jgi:hypothetical protein
MPEGRTTGVPDPDKPGNWLVPPWPPGATFSELVSHFTRFYPWSNTKTTHLLAYYDGYQAALDIAAQLPACSLRQRWYANMHECISRCAQIHRERYSEEISVP